MTEADILALLAQRYSAPEYAFLTHVANGTGGRATRTIDAVAMSLWPSRGLSLHGFEVKTSRNDWLRELKNPAKAEGWRFDYFWLVTPLDVVNYVEMPRTWGLLEINSSQRIHVTKEAPDLKPKALTRHMLAALLRKTHAVSVTADERTAAHLDGFAAGVAQAKADVAADIELWRKQRDAARARVDALQGALGISQYDDATLIAPIVGAIRRLGIAGVRNRLSYQQRTIRDLLTEHDIAIDKLTALEAQHGEGQQTRRTETGERPRPADDREKDHRENGDRNDRTENRAADVARVDPR